MARLLIAFLASICLVSAVQAEDGKPASDLPAGWHPFIGLSLASKHFGADRDFQEFNPGISLGARHRVGWRRGEWGFEAGGFQNSYDNRSFYVGSWIDWPIARPSSSTEIRLGGFFAYAEYPELKDEADDIGVLTIGDFVPIISAQASLRIDERFALTARFGPGIEDSLLIVGLQAFYFF